MEYIFCRGRRALQRARLRGGWAQRMRQPLFKQSTSR
jgi:hypothetical protein